VFSISGFSGTGKTTLMESIVRVINSQGYSVIIVKSSQHEPREGQGTDTERYLQAGAIASFFRGPTNRGKSLREIVSPSVSDFLLVEGMKTSSIPKFWCVGDSPVGDTIPVEVRAIISWDTGKVIDRYGVPILEPDDLEQMVSIIMKEAIDLNLIVI
jgi:molybdopterin-guanine dinucleotide biosynthesis protein MobB